MNDTVWRTASVLTFNTELKTVQIIALEPNRNDM